MDASAWEHRGPVTHPGYVESFAALPAADGIFPEVPERGERVGSCRMVCGTYALQAISAIGFVMTLWWIAGTG